MRSQTVSILARIDMEVEGEERVSISLTNSAPNVALEPASADIVIVDRTGEWVTDERGTTGELSVPCIDHWLMELNPSSSVPFFSPPLLSLLPLSPPPLLPSSPLSPLLPSLPSLSSFCPGSAPTSRCSPRRTSQHDLCDCSRIQHYYRTVVQR